MKHATLLSSLLAIFTLILATHLASTAAMRPGIPHLVSDAADRAKQLHDSFLPNMDYDPSIFTEAAPPRREQSRPSLSSRIRSGDRTGSSVKEALKHARTQVRAAERRLAKLRGSFKRNPKTERDFAMNHSLALQISEAEDALSHARRDFNHVVEDSGGSEEKILLFKPTLDEEIQGAKRRAEAALDAEWESVERRPFTDRDMLQYIAIRLEVPLSLGGLELTRLWLHRGVRRQAYEDLFIELWSQGRRESAVKLVDKLGGDLVQPSPHKWEQMPSALTVQLQEAYDALRRTETVEPEERAKLLERTELLIERAVTKHQELSDGRDELETIGQDPQLRKMTRPGQDWSWLKWASARRDAEAKTLHQLSNKVANLV